jgi:protein-disulfide isomerase
MNAPRLVLPVTARDHVRGPATAAVTLLEYGDYECPHCGAAHPVVEAVRWHMGTRMRFVYRHFPLSQAHPHAERAAQAAEAAGAQGQFWPLHDQLFTNQHDLDDDSLMLYAAALGLDVGRFAEDLATGIHAPRVREDFMSGVRSGVNGTPTFFFNGLRYDGRRDVESLVAAAEDVHRVLHLTVP